MTEPIWWITKDGDERCLELFEGHYTYRKGRKQSQFVGPGQKIVLRTYEVGEGFGAMFVWRRFIDDSKQKGVNCAVFRNCSGYRSSDLIRQADAIADFCWPGERHYTFVNAKKIKSTNPGYCFQKAGWEKCGVTAKGLIVLERQPL